MPLSAVRVLAEFRSSSSLPVLVETSLGMKCVLKWKGSAEGSMATATEWVSLKLAHHAGVPVPTPHLITVSPTLAETTDNGEVRDIIRRSPGTNLGIEFLENATPFAPGFINNVDPPIRNLIFLFDVLLLNIDRTDLNPNMIVSKGRLYCIDYAASMAIKMMINQANHPEQSLLYLLRRHPFYSATVRADDFAFSPGTQLITKIFQSVPDEWLADSKATPESAISGLIHLLANSRSVLERRLASLDSTPLESVESIRARALRNRKAFEEKLESDRKSRIL